MMKRVLILLLSLSMFPDDAFSQEKKEKPISLDWGTLSHVRWVKDEKKQVYRIKYGEQIKPYHGKIVDITGFMVSLDMDDKPSYFMLSANPASACFFCGGAGPESVIEVMAEKPIDYSWSPVTLRGRLRLEVKEEEFPVGMFYFLSNAKLIQ